MGKSLWFVTNGVQLIGVFEQKSQAEQEKTKYQDDPDYNYYDFYSVNIEELDDYPDEYDIAYDQGFVS